MVQASAAWAGAWVALAAAVLLVLSPAVFDNGQCDRVCRLEYAGGIMSPVRRDSANGRAVTVSGRRDRRASRDECECLGSGGQAAETVVLGRVPRLYQSVDKGYPYIHKGNKEVCGEDGAQYASADLARAAGVRVTNCGRCGKCSNAHDVGRFRDLGDTMIKTVASCVVAYLVLPRQAAQWCMHHHVGLSRPCADCWVEDQGCLVAHCYYECVFNVNSWLSSFSRAEEHEQWADDKSSECLDCMETLCSKPYLDSCGANRRMAGVVSDITRDAREICAEVNLFDDHP